MGTNYYFHKNVCEHCKRSDEPLHIGKSSAGWTFSFRGYRSEWDEPRITSYAEWIACFAKTLGEIRDEYGERISYTDFHAKIVAQMNQPNNHTTDLMNGNMADRYYALEHCWLDPEGHSFQEGEFC